MLGSEHTYVHTDDSQATSPHSVISISDSQEQELNEGLVHPERVDKTRRDTRKGPTSVSLFGSNESSRRKALLALIDRLIHLGINKDTELPQIAAIGDQSVGKSSVVELITGVKLPRQSGTCTRCATECLVKNSDGPWTCVVFIYYDDGSPPVQFGPIITKAEEVTERVRRAQKAILNTKAAELQVQDYLDESIPLPDTNGSAFSRDYISLKISGPDLVDLSFVDLPGLIHSVGDDQDEADIGLVQDLIIRYIEKKSCLILLTIACNMDMENQAAWSLAKKYDSKGERTIGVLTKPDLIQAKEEGIWISRVRNTDNSRKLKLGWYCVKLMSSVELDENLSREDAFKREEMFFTKPGNPWSALSMKEHNLGVQRLVTSLSDTLSRIIAERIPVLQNELQALFTESEKDLDQLPTAPAEDPISEMTAIISEFSADVNELVQGRPGEQELHQMLRQKQDLFRERIRSTAPDFRPYLDDDCDDRVEMEFLASEESETIDNGPTFTIKDVFKKIQSARSRELPGNIPFVVTRELIKSTIEEWGTHASMYFEDAYIILEASLKSLIVKHFGKYKVGNLESKVSAILIDTMEQKSRVAREHLRYELKKELFAFTLNNRYLEDYKAKFDSRYRSRWMEDKAGSDDVVKLLRNPKSHDRDQAETLRYVLSGLKSLGVTIEDSLDLTKLLPKDNYDESLDLMALVRAYFHVSSKRFIDNVPLAIDCDLITAIADDVRRALFDGLIKGDNRDRCGLFLQEDMQISARRMELTKKLERLREAKREMLTV